MVEEMRRSKITEENLKSVKQKMTEIAPDFAKRVAPVYQLLDWDWVISIPTEKEIYEHVMDQIERLSLDVFSISSGGIITSWDDSEGIVVGRLMMEIYKEVYV